MCQTIVTSLRAVATTAKGRQNKTSIFLEFVNGARFEWEIWEEWANDERWEARSYTQAARARGVGRAEARLAGTKSAIGRGVRASRSPTRELECGGCDPQPKAILLAVMPWTQHLPR